MTGSRPRHVLITFGRSFLTLELARLMAAGGHRVSVVDSIRIGISRFSDAVDEFHLVPPPKFEPRRYCEELARIVADTGVDMVIPIHEETDILSMMVDLFPPSCTLFLSDFETENRLHNKYEFQKLLDERGFPTLRYAQIADPSDIRSLAFDGPFALKQCYSRGSQKIHKAFPGEPLDWLDIDPTNPWLAQEWMSGAKYCSYSVCHEGTITAHAVYPIEYAIGGSSCLTFRSVEHQGILDWVTEFLREMNFTGQVGFDFIEDPERGLFCIECNPRATSGVMMFDTDSGLDRAFFAENDEVIVPNGAATRMIGAGMALYGWRRSSLPDNTIRGFLRDFRRYDDVIASAQDRKPAALLPFAYLGIVRSCLKYHVGLAEGFMHDHEWDGRPV